MLTAKDISYIHQRLSGEMMTYISYAALEKLRRGWSTVPNALDGINETMERWLSNESYLNTVTQPQDVALSFIVGLETLVRDIAFRATEKERARCIALATDHANSGTASPDWRQCAQSIREKIEDPDEW